VLGPKRRDLSALKEPFHRKYANCPPDPWAALMFTKQYGLLDYDREFTGRTDVAGLKFSFHMRDWLEQRAMFLSAWVTASINPRKPPWAIVPSFFPWPSNDRTCAPLGDELVVKGPETFWSLTRDDLIAQVYSKTAWEYLWALLCFEKSANLRKCQNPECDAPYFIATRKDQLFCGGDCAHRIAVRRWWTKHGNAWRKGHPGPKNR